MRNREPVFIIVAVTAATAAIGALVTSGMLSPVAIALSRSGPMPATTAISNPGAVSHVSDTAVLLTRSTRDYPAGLWRDDYATGFDAPPLFFRPGQGPCSLNSGNGDGGSQVKSRDGKCWLAIFPAEGLDVREFGAAPNGDATASVQAAFDAAYRSRLPTQNIRVPIGLHYTHLLMYSGEKLECAGETQPLIRTAAGPGLVTTDAPGNGYPKGVVWGISIRDCTFQDGNGLPGANLIVAEAQSYHLDNVRSYSRLAGAEFNGQLDAAQNTLTVNSIVNGTIIPGAAGTGMLIECAGAPSCLSTNQRNQYPAVRSQTGTGTGSARLYDTGSNTPNISARDMVGLISWTWPSSPGNKVLPSAPLSFIGSTFDGEITNVYAGGYYTSPTAGACTNYSGAGILLDTTQVNGSGKPNHNTFTQVYTPCANVGMLVNNGADNTFVNTDHQFDNYAWLIGAGQGNAARNIIINPYLEGATRPPQITSVGFGLSRDGDRTTIIGQGSNNGVINPIISYGNGNCWTVIGAGKTVGGNQPADQTWCSSGRLLTGQEASLYSGPGSTVPGGMYAAEAGFWWYRGKTVQSLPRCDVGAAGQAYWVTDSRTGTYADRVTGGGSHKVLAICDGSNWTAH